MLLFSFRLQIAGQHLSNIFHIPKIRRQDDTDDVIEKLDHTICYGKPAKKS
jgi:hypothetical protein